VTALDNAAQASARSRLAIPAAGVLVAGSMDLAFLALVLLKTARGMAGVSSQAVAFGLPLLAMLFLPVVIIAGAAQMKRLARYRLAIVASILAILIPPGALAGLPFGIWSLVLLSQPEVRAAFDRAGGNQLRREGRGV
jgi:hypothetical protein